jgi:hypothetical protein
MAHHLAQVRPSGLIAKPYLVPSGDSVFDSKIQVRHHPSQVRYQGLDAFGASGERRVETLVLDACRAHHFVYGVEVALAEAFFDQSANGLHVPLFLLLHF